MECNGRPVDCTSGIGRSVPRRDAITKVTGEEKYAADYYGENFLWTGVKRAGIPHGRLIAVHVNKAIEVPGIVKILTYKDIAGSNRVGVLRKDQPVLVDTRIRYMGDPVALVLAENREAIRHALKLITFEYEPLPAAFTIDDALKDDAPKIHEENEDRNILRTITINVGRGASTIDGSPFVVEGEFEVPFQEHAYLETEAGWAKLEEDGRLVIVASTQTPFRDCFEIAPAIGIDVNRLRVIAPYLGGGFGGKDGVTVQCLLGLAALNSQGRAVKMWWDREESFMAGVKRLPVRMHYWLGARKTGEFDTLHCTLYYEAGAYANLGGEIMTLGVEHAGSAYRIPNVSIEAKCVYTNNPLGGPFRGFGVPQVMAGIEQIVDMMAYRIGMDPLQIRLVNAVKKGDNNCIGVPLTYSTGIIKCLEALGQHTLWKEKEKWKNAAGPFKTRGVGVAAMSHAIGYPPVIPDYANAKIELTNEGKIKVYVGIVDMGQGNASTYLQLAASILGQKESEMEVVLPDTSRTLPSGSSSASRCTYVYGNALILAAEALAHRIREKASHAMGDVRSGSLTLVPGGVRYDQTGAEITFADLISHFSDTERISEKYYQAPVAQDMNDLIYLGPHVLYTYAAHLTRVEVDRLTGTVEVIDYLSVTDAGKVINPQIYEQQIEGGIAQGIGYALSEDFKVLEGKVETENLATYIIPGALDVPDITSWAVEIGEPTGPFGMKGIGEIGISGTLPTIANAVADACGVRIVRSPLTAEKILAAMKGDREAG